MILATNSLAGASDAASRQYNLCTSSSGSTYLAKVDVASWFAHVSHGLSARRKIAAQQSGPIVVVADAFSIHANDSPPFCLKV